MDYERKTPKCSDIPSEFWYPCGAHYCEVPVYRLTKLPDAVLDEDFLSQYEIDKKRGTINTELLHNDKYYGVSVLGNKKDAEKLLKKVVAMKHKYNGIAYGTTCVTDGVIRHTPNHSLSSHITWWLFEGAMPETYFTSLHDGGNDD